MGTKRKKTTTNNVRRYKFIEEEHLHTLDGNPLQGTTTILKVISKPLTYWASGLACAEFGWIKKLDTRKSTPEQVKANELVRQDMARRRQNDISLMSTGEYLTLLDKAYRAHATNLKESSSSGTNLHAELEEYVKACMKAEKIFHPGLKANAAILCFYEWAKDNVSRFIVSEGFCYSEVLWTGGGVDLVYEDNKGRIAIMDFKSSKEAYMSHYLQCASYDIAISENGIFDKKGKRLYTLEKPIEYYAIFPFGMMEPTPQFHFDTKGAQEGFKAACVLNKIINQT